MYEACDSQEIPYINRSPYAFDHVISYMTDPNYKVPEQYEIELKFYTVDYTSKNIYCPTLFVQNMIKNVGETLLDKIMIKTYECAKCTHDITENLLCQSCYCRYINRCLLCENLTNSHYCNIHLGKGFFCNYYNCDHTRMENYHYCFLHYKNC